MFTRSVRILATILRTATLVTIFVIAGMGAYDETGYDQTQGKIDRPGLTLPALDREAFPGCTTAKRFDGIPAAVVVVTLHGDLQRMNFDHAWKRGTNDSWADDVWTVGLCS